MVSGVDRDGELPRCGRFRLSCQFAGRELLRDRNRLDRESRAYRDDGCIRDARGGPPVVLPALPDATGVLERSCGRTFILVAQPGTRLDGLLQLVPGRNIPAL